MGYEKNHRSFIENKIIGFLEEETNPQSSDSIIVFLREEGVTLEKDKIQAIIGYLEEAQKVLIVKSSERYRLTINPKWRELKERRERVEIRKYMQREAVL